MTTEVIHQVEKITQRTNNDLCFTDRNIALILDETSDDDNNEDYMKNRDSTNGGK